MSENGQTIYFNPEEGGSSELQIRVGRGGHTVPPHVKIALQTVFANAELII